MINMKDKMLSLKNNGFFHILIGNTLTKMLAFLSSVVIVRLVSKESFAHLAFTDNIYMYISIFAGIGMANALLKFIPNATSTSEEKAYLIFSIKWGTMFQIIIAFLVLIYSKVFTFPFDNVDALIQLMIFYPIFIHIFSSITNYFRAKIMNKRFLLISVSQAFLILISSFIFVKAYGVIGVIYARYLSIIFILIICVFLIKNLLFNKDLSSFRLNKLEKKSFILISISMLLANFFSMIIPLNEMSLVSSILNDEIIVANYKVAVLIPSQLTFITSSVVVYFFPIMVKMKKNSDIWKFSKSIAFYTFLLILAITLFGIAFTPLIIKILYGQDYLDALPLFYIFWAVYFLNSGFRMIALNILPAIGAVRFNAIISIVSSILHFVISLVLISKFGIYGTAIGTAIVYIISGVIFWVYIYKFLHKERRE